MSIALCYWILMAIWLIFGIATRNSTNARLTVGGNSIIIFVLLVLIGWSQFGAPIHD